MDPAIDLAPTPGPQLSLPRIAVGLTALAAAVPLLLWSIEAIGRTASGELVWPIPPDAWGAVVFATAFLTIVMLARYVASGCDPATFRRGRRGNAFDALVGGPIVLLIALSWTARLAVQLVGFAGLHPADVPVAFTVVATTHDRARGGTDYYRLRLRYGEQGRTFGDRVGKAVYEAAQDGDTVVLPVETGRFGLQRAMVATPIGVADLHHRPG